MQNTYETHGKNNGHLLRRFIHLSLIIIPFLYYWYGNSIANFLKISVDQCVSIIVFIIILLEICRLKFKWLFIGQRNYESNQISAFAWTTFAIALVLLIAPKIGYMQAAIGAPLIWSLAIVDPLLGEFRRYEISKKISIFIGIMATSIIWLACALWLGTPIWFFIIIPAITIFSEWQKISAIDDNAMMLLVPLAFCILLMPWV